MATVFLFYDPKKKKLNWINCVFFSANLTNFDILEIKNLPNFQCHKIEEEEEKKKTLKHNLVFE